MLIGLMGKSGSGKSLISKLLKELDYRVTVIDVDKIGHESHNDRLVRVKLAEYFGDYIFDSDGSVNRKELGKIVFSDKSKMELLYDATYNYMVERIESMIKDCQITVLDYALLPLTKYFELCDVKIFVRKKKGDYVWLSGTK